MPRILRILVAVVLTAIVLYTAHPSDVIRATGDADLRWLAAAIALVLVDRSLMALRWIDLLIAVTPGSRPPFPRVLRILKRNGFDGVVIPDHAPQLTCEAPWHSGMAFAMGYLKACLQNAEGNSTRDGV